MKILVSSCLNLRSSQSSGACFTDLNYTVFARLKVPQPPPLPDRHARYVFVPFLTASQGYLASSLVSINYLGLGNVLPYLVATSRASKGEENMGKAWRRTVRSEDNRKMERSE